jgi:hypothetical protein
LRYVKWGFAPIQWPGPNPDSVGSLGLAFSLNADVQSPHSDPALANAILLWLRIEVYPHSAQPQERDATRAGPVCGDLEAKAIRGKPQFNVPQGDYNPLISKKCEKLMDETVS